MLFYILCWKKYRTFPISTSVDITVYQHGECFVFVEYNFLLHVIYYRPQEAAVSTVGLLMLQQWQQLMLEDC